MCCDVQTEHSGYFTRRRLTLFTVFLRFLLMGFEYAIILPTIVLFLQKLSGNPVTDDCRNSIALDVGLSISAMSFSALISAPIFGRISDKTRSTKTAVVIGNLCEVAGSLMYSFSQNSSTLIVSRLLAGVGIGPAASIMGMVSRSTPDASRTSTISLIYSMRQVGVIIGPGCNLFLREPIFHFWIGSFSIDEYTLPTFFMAILWFFHTVMVFFLYDDLPSLSEENAFENSNDHTGDNGPINDISNGSGVEINYQSSDIDDVNKVTVRPILSRLDLLKDMLSEEGISCLGATFILATVSLGVEAIITPLTCRLFLWTGFENSLFFLVSGILYVIGMFSVAKLSSKFSDEALIVVGLAVMFANSLLFLFFAIFGASQSDEPWVLGVFLTYGCVFGLFFSVAFVPIVSLITKISSERNQGFNQGIQMLSMRIGMILGPIWTTAMIDNYLSIMAAVNTSISMLPLIMFGFSYTKFKRRRLYMALAN